jgi:cysteine desulfurase
MEQFPQGNVVISAVEHDAVTVPAKQFEHKICAVQSSGRIDVEALRSLIDDKTVLVSVMYANNEIGTIQPIHDIAKIIKKILIERKIKASSSNNFKALPIYLHTDACQAANYLPLLTNTLGVDLMTLNGGKIYGPKQSGILYVRTGLVLSPQILGGGQERSFRSGTENVAGIVGFAASLKEAGLMRSTESDRLRQLSGLFINKLAKKVPNTIVNGSIKHRLPNNIHITVPGCDNERLMMELDERGLMVATGSACSASSDEPSHVLKAIGLSDAHAYSSLRITFGRQTTEAEVRQLVNNLSDIVAK